MLISLITTLAIVWVCALYVWEAYDLSSESEEPPQQPRPVEHAGWDSLLGLKTSEFAVETGEFDRRD